MASGPIRVVLADDHQLFRRGLRQLIEVEPDIRVVAEATNGSEALGAIAGECPDVLVLDLSMPVLDGLAVLEALPRTRPELPVLVLTMHGEESILLRALANGARGLARKDAETGEIVQAIRSLATGHGWIEARAVLTLLDEYRRLYHEAARPVSGRLSERDVALLRLLATGQSNKEIGAVLGLAESTVKNQLGSLFTRIGVNDRTQAALYAFSHGVLATDLAREVAPA